MLPIYCSSSYSGYSLLFAAKGRARASPLSPPPTLLRSALRTIEPTTAPHRASTAHHRANDGSHRANDGSPSSLDGSHRANDGSPSSQRRLTIEPTTAPIEPTTAPIEPTTAPIEPRRLTIEPTTAPIEPRRLPIEPTTAPHRANDGSPSSLDGSPSSQRRLPIEPRRLTIEPTTAPIEPTTAHHPASTARTPSNFQGWSFSALQHLQGCPSSPSPASMLQGWCSLPTATHNAFLHAKPLAHGFLSPGGFPFLFFTFPNFSAEHYFPHLAMLPQGCEDPQFPGGGQTAPKLPHATELYWFCLSLPVLHCSTTKVLKTSAIFG